MKPVAEAPMTKRSRCGHDDPMHAAKRQFTEAARAALAGAPDAPELVREALEQVNHARGSATTGRRIGP